MGILSGVKGAIGGFIGGGPTGAVLGGLGGLLGDEGGKGGGGLSAGSLASLFSAYPSAAGTLADPNIFYNIRLPGINYPEGRQLVDYPEYPNAEPYPSLPSYYLAPQLPTNMPTLPAPKLQAATRGEREAFEDTSAARSAYTSSVNPLDPKVLRLAKNTEQLTRNAQYRNLQDLIKASRREKNLGRDGLFDGERGSENIYRAINQGGSDARLSSVADAMNLMKLFGDNMGKTAALSVSNAALETQRRNAFRADLLNYINQVRGDVVSRTNTAREDYNSRLNMARGDKLDAYNQRRLDVFGKYDRDVDLITSALDVQNRNAQTTARAQGAYNQGRSDYNQQRANTIGNGLSGLFSGLGQNFDLFDVVPNAGEAPGPKLPNQLYSLFG